VEAIERFVGLQEVLVLVEEAFVDTEIEFAVHQVIEGGVGLLLLLLLEILDFLDLLLDLLLDDLLLDILLLLLLPLRDLRNLMNPLHGIVRKMLVFLYRNNPKAFCMSSACASSSLLCFGPVLPSHRRCPASC